LKVKNRRGQTGGECKFVWKKGKGRREVKAPGLRKRRSGPEKEGQGPYSSKGALQLIGGGKREGNPGEREVFKRFCTKKMGEEKGVFRGGTALGWRSSQKGHKSTWEGKGKDGFMGKENPPLTKGVSCIA